MTERIGVQSIAYTETLKSPGTETCSGGLSVAKKLLEQRYRRGDALRWFAN